MHYWNLQEKGSKEEITEEVKKIINRIKRKWVNLKILVFGDMNESKDSQVTKLKKSLEIGKSIFKQKNNNQRTKYAWKTEGIDTWLLYIKQRNK